MDVILRIFPLFFRSIKFPPILPPTSTTWNQKIQEPEMVFLSYPLPSHPRLFKGQLENGLRYQILTNKVPPHRFEAKLKVHVGSIDEEDDEQGIAHMVEHIGCRNTGVGCDGLTEFHHTLFHIGYPTHKKDSYDDLLLVVLHALNEATFHAKMLASWVEEERKAILSELQMKNTIEYCVMCQLMLHLHSENKLSRRQTIGLEEQIKVWDADKVRKFHECWYHPGNATFYIAGDLDNSKTIDQIEAVFDQTGAENATVVAPSIFGEIASFLVSELNAGIGGSFSPDGPASSLELSKFIKKERFRIRRPLQHKWSISANFEKTKPPQIFQHELLQNFSLYMFCKTPVDKLQTYGDLRNFLMKRIILSVLQSRNHLRCKVQRLKEFGVTKGELARCMGEILKGSEDLAATVENVSSICNLDSIIEKDTLGHRVMDQRQEHESLVVVSTTVTLEEVNAIGAKMLEFITEFEKPSAPRPAAIVSCVPKKVQIDGKDQADFLITSGEITKAIREALKGPIEHEPELEVPKKLMSPSHLQQLRNQRKSSFISNQHDNETGITQRRLSNNISVNYKVSKSEARKGVMRLIVGGGRASEIGGSWGSIFVGIQTLAEDSHVGNFSKDQSKPFRMNHLENWSLEVSEDLILMETRFSLTDNGMRAAFDHLHIILEHGIWADDAFDRSKQLVVSNYRSLHTSLERLTMHKLMLALLNSDERFVEPSPQSLDNLTLESVRYAVLSQFFGENMEVSIVGDFSEEEIESCILDYLGTVSATKMETVSQISPIIFRPSPSDLQFQQVLLKDTEKRSCAYLAGPAPSLWGFTADGEDIFESIKNEDAQSNLQKSFRSHPLFFLITMDLLEEIINRRLLSSVRYNLCLTYDVSFRFNLFDRLKLGWYVISVSSTPGKVYEAVDACKVVLRGLHSDQLLPSEFNVVKEAMLMKYDEEINSNAFWLESMGHLQASSVPRKDISCIRDQRLLYEACTIADIYITYEKLGIDDNALYTCVGFSQAGEV